MAKLVQGSPVRVWMAWLLRRLADWVLALMIISLPWRLRLVLVRRPYPPIYRDFTDILLHLPEMLLVVLLLLWGIELWLQPRRLWAGPRWIWWPLLGLTTAGILSVIDAVDPALSAYHGLHLLLLLALYLYLVNEQNSLRFLVWPVSIMLTLQAVVGLGQVWQQHGLGLNWLGERLLDPSGGAATVWGQEGLVSLRAYGLTDHPNILAINLVLGMLLLLAWIGTRPRTTSLWFIVASLLFAGSAIVLLLTYSRPGWIGLAGGGLILVKIVKENATWNLRPQTWIVLTGLTAMFLAPFVWWNLPFLSMGTTAEMMSARVQERLDSRAESQALNNITNRLFAAHALNGVGLGGLPRAIKQGTTDFNYDFQPSRVTPLTVAAEIGLPGGALYLALQLGPWILIGLNKSKLQIDPMFVGMTAVLMAMTIIGLQDAYTWSYLPGRMWQWLAWGLWTTAYVRARRQFEGLAHA